MILLIWIFGCFFEFTRRGQRTLEEAEYFLPIAPQNIATRISPRDCFYCLTESRLLGDIVTTLITIISWIHRLMILSDRLKSFCCSLNAIRISLYICAKRPTFFGLILLPSIWCTLRAICFFILTSLIFSYWSLSIWRLFLLPNSMNFGMILVRLS